jgi:transposase
MEGSTMPHFVGLDVALRTTHVVIVDELGEVTREGVVETEPKAIIGFLRGDRLRFRRVVLEAGPLCQWLYAALAAKGLPIVCIEARHASAVLKTRPNKTDRNDALGLAELARNGHFRPVHVKTEESLTTRAMLSARRLVQRKLVDIESSIRGILNPFGIKISRGRRLGYADQVRAALVERPQLAQIIDPLLRLQAELFAVLRSFDRDVVAAAEADPVCRRLMTAPGVGALVALTYRAAIDIPERFSHSRDVGPHLGLTPRIQQSGVTGWRSRISKCGDQEARRALFAAARAMLPTYRRACWLKDWGQAIKARAGGMKAQVAVARRLAVILHRMWISETDFRWEAASP